MFGHPERKVSILRHDTVLFNPVALSNFMLQDSQMVAVLNSVPAQRLSFRQLPRGAMGVCLKNEPEKGQGRGTNSRLSRKVGSASAERRTTNI
jgi:hypothetical protein